MRSLLCAVAATIAGAAAAPALAQYGPVTITGTVATNQLVCGRFSTVLPGDHVTMFFRTLPGGFSPFWGPTGRFVNVDESSYELHIGTGVNEKVCYSAANGTSMLFTNAGFITTAVSQDLMEFFQMSLDSSSYQVYFKATDHNAGVWPSPLIGLLPPVTPASRFDFEKIWTVTDSCPNDGSGPTLTINFDGNITVPCRADFNNDGHADVNDIFAMLTAWFSGRPGGDFNADGATNVQDIFDFLGVWFRGCPV